MNQWAFQIINLPFTAFHIRDQLFISEISFSYQRSAFHIRDQLFISEISFSYQRSAFHIRDRHIDTLNWFELLIFNSSSSISQPEMYCRKPQKWHTAIRTIISAVFIPLCISKLPAMSCMHDTLLYGASRQNTRRLGGFSPNTHTPQM